MNRKERYEFVLNYFQEFAPEAETELIFDGPYQLLVAVILSAQCTDKRVNMTTPAVFQKYPDPYTLAEANYEALFDLVKSISYPGNKSRHLIGHGQITCRKIQRPGSDDG
jgi:endonuclease III